MQKKLLLAIAAILFIVINALFISDGWVYLTTSLLAVFIILVTRRFSSKFIKLTRWAKANPRKTQVFITVLQLAIISLGLLIGYNLKELGYQLSSKATIVFGVILCYGFFSVRFLPKRNTIALPINLNKDRLAYLSIILSAFVLMVITGNRIEDRFPDSAISHTLRSIDQAIFAQHFPPADAPGLESASNSNQQEATSMDENASMFSFASLPLMKGQSATTTIDPKKGIQEKIKAERKAQKLERKKERAIKQLIRLRKAYGAGQTILTILLVFLLLNTTCAGICLIVLGTSAGSVLLGVLITAASIFGIVKVFSKKKRTKPKS